MSSSGTLFASLHHESINYSFARSDLSTNTLATGSLTEAIFPRIQSKPIQVWPGFASCTRRELIDSILKHGEPAVI